MMNAIFPSPTANQWNDTMPAVLVVACSDGRFQMETDRFLHEELGLGRYDRLYVPGGGGALVPDGARARTATVYRHDAELLIRLHGIREVVLLFHGPAPGGPSTALCGGYLQAFPDADADRLRRQQEADASLLLSRGLGPAVALRAYRATVSEGLAVQFAPMAG